MSNATMKKEYPEQKQRLAVCYSQFRKKKSESVEKKYDEKGRVIVAENVPIIIGATIEVSENVS